MLNFLTDGITNVVSAADFSALLTTLQAQFTVASVVEILGIIVAAGAGFVFMWWGVRKLIGGLMSAFKKGKLSL